MVPILSLSTISKTHELITDIHLCKEAVPNTTFYKGHIYKFNCKYWFQGMMWVCPCVPRHPDPLFMQNSNGISCPHHCVPVSELVSYYISTMCILYVHFINLYTKKRKHHYTTYTCKKVYLYREKPLSRGHCNFMDPNF